ncbi:hypothetical protein M3Y94_00275500 [Aphelenchoides besseyi]|nr:hypothetical protein M3Y94_00275500 [Aphelenchoides besseyi]KAI6236049.1 hypothetical protein M3Y95_00116100 [Aphelenchoides besseyi]
MNKLVDLFLCLGSVVASTLIGIIRAILPSGVLKQKTVQNEVVLITGAGSGIGRELAIRFAQRRAHLILWDLNSKLNEETKELLRVKGYENVKCYTVDVGNKSEVYETGRQVGRVDIVISNAGIVHGKKLLNCPDELMEKTVGVNMNALFYLSKAFVPGMIERDHGHFVITASMAGKVGVAGLADYCASKFGAVGFAEALRAELRIRSRNLHVTLICPYYIKTGMFDGVDSSSPLLLPLLEPDYAADRIVEAILTNTVILYMPRFCYWIMAVKELLPTAAAELIADFVGVNYEMETFRGRNAQSG